MIKQVEMQHNIKSQDFAIHEISESPLRMQKKELVERAQTAKILEPK